MTSLIGPPSEDLERGLSILDEGEEWLVAPTPVGGGGWSPGVRLGVRPGSFLHTTECFGPVLGVMRVTSLDEAIDIANGSEFGLTGGLHSLDEEEIDRWCARIEVGNAYVNRTTTGAVVRRQPFGGWRKSVFGPAAKAGGPNYVVELGTWWQRITPSAGVGTQAEVAALVEPFRDQLSPDQAEILQSVAADFGKAWTSHYSVEHDPSRLTSESNVFRYRPLPRLVVRVAEDRPLDAAVAVVAIRITGQHPEVTVAPGAEEVVPGAGVMSDADFAEWLAGTPFARVRFIGRPTVAEWRAARASHSHIADEPVVLNGRLELRHYLREQVVTRSIHRHGMLPVRTHLSGRASAPEV